MRLMFGLGLNKVGIVVVRIGFRFGIRLKFHDRVKDNEGQWGVVKVTVKVNVNFKLRLGLE